MDTILQSAILFLTGIVAGIESGAFGVGGGSLMTPVQFWLYTFGGIDSTLAIRIAFGTSLAVILPTMISGALAHHRHGAVEWHAALPMGVAAIFGGLAGGIAASHVPGHVLRLFFAIFILIVAVRMFWRVRECAESEMRGSAVQFLVTGFFIGVLSGLTPAQIQQMLRTELLRRAIQNHAILKNPNVVFTPHNAFNSTEAVARKAEQSVRSVEHYLKTGELVNEETLKDLSHYRAIYLGAIGDPHTPQEGLLP